MSYKFSTQLVRKICFFVIPIGLLTWIGLSIGVLFGNQFYESTAGVLIFYAFIFLFPLPYLIFVAIEMNYEIEFQNDKIKYVKKGIFKNIDTAIFFKDIIKARQTFLKSLVVEMKDGTSYTFVNYLLVDFQSMSTPAQEVFKALEVEPMRKGVSLIKLLLIQNLGTNEDLELSHKERKAFDLLQKRIN